MREAVGVDGRSRSLKIRIIAVQELMPESLAALEGGKTESVLPEEVENLVPPRITFRKHIKHLAHGEDRPSVGAAPVV